MIFGFTFEISSLSLTEDVDLMLRRLVNEQNHIKAGDLAVI